MPIWISLLRAVNLGARNKVPMPRLREVLADAGFRDVQTLVQSGNVVASSRHRSEASVARDVRDLLVEHFDVDTPVVVRSAADMAATQARDPFPELTSTEPKLVQVVFHTEVIADPEPLLERAAEGDERVHVAGRDVHVAYPLGIGRSKLTPAVMARLLGQDGTARNWRTVTALTEMTGGSRG